MNSPIFVPILVALSCALPCRALAPVSSDERRILEALGYRAPAQGAPFVSDSGDVLDDARLECLRAALRSAPERELSLRDLSCSRREPAAGSARAEAPARRTATLELAAVEEFAADLPEDSSVRWDGARRRSEAPVQVAARPTGPQKRCDDGYTDGIRGAFFRKIVGKPSWSAIGIRGSGQLPKVSISRWSTKKGFKDIPDFYKYPLDIPAIFMGGEGRGRTLDAGLSWDRVHDRNGKPYFTDSPDGCDGGDPLHRFRILRRARTGPIEVYDGNGASIPPTDEFLAKLRPDFAFRPYWRTTGEPGKPWHNPKLGPEDRYFFPGESFTMEVRAAERRGWMVLSIHGAHSSFQAVFRQRGFDYGGRGGLSFKRNNELDQFKELSPGVFKGREKQSILRTSTAVTDARWDSVVLFDRRGRTTPLAGRDCVEVRGVETAPAYSHVYRLSGMNSSGGEIIDILPEEVWNAKSRGERGARGGPR